MMEPQWQPDSFVDDDTLDLRESYPLQEAVAHRQGWDDPRMDEYAQKDSTGEGRGM